MIKLYDTDIKKIPALMVGNKYTAGVKRMLESLSISWIINVVINFRKFKIKTKNDENVYSMSFDLEENTIKSLQ